MNKSIIVFNLPSDEVLAVQLAEELNADVGEFITHEFPDGEMYVRGVTACEGKIAILAADLSRPNSLLLPLLFCIEALKELGAERVILVSPYLPYMRQDKKFKTGEVLTSKIFARLLSDAVSGLVTVDPHLHRYKDLSEIYSIPTKVQHADVLISKWIADNVNNPLIVGPDQESEQWVSKVAAQIGAPYIVLTKIRKGDREVKISVPHFEPYLQHTPVLVDDIISTAQTMIETTGHLINAGYMAPVCVGVHAIFAGNAYADLQSAGAAQIITCNTIHHPSNTIDITSILASGVGDLCVT